MCSSYIIDKKALWTQYHRCLGQVWFRAPTDRSQTCKDSQWVEGRSSGTLFTNPSWTFEVGCEDPPLQHAFINIQKSNCSWSSGEVLQQGIVRNHNIPTSRLRKKETRTMLVDYALILPGLVRNNLYYPLELCLKCPPAARKIILHIFTT